MDTHTPPRHYSLLHRTLTEGGSQLKARGGGGREVGSIKANQCQQGGGPAPLPPQLLQACPGLLGVGGSLLGCGKGLPAWAKVCPDALLGQ